MNYLGSKSASGAYQAIIAAMPAHDVYIEAFLGSGAVMCRKPAAARSIGIDLDARMLDLSRYPDVELVWSDAPGYIANYDYAGSCRTLIYADPPYVLSTRGKARYKHDFEDRDHVRLLDVLKQVPADVMISGYPCTLYSDILADWRSIQFQVMTRGGVRTEQLWMNYPADTPLYSSMFAGSNYTDRQRIKRKAKRWADNFQALPPAERMAILSALLGTA